MGDLDGYDRALLESWLAGPGARPTAEDSERWIKATRDGSLPRRPAVHTDDEAER